MVHQSLRTTPHADTGLPLVDAATNRILTFDGRLDDRDGLIAILELDASARTLSDASLILGAYERWGAGCPEFVLGDFAFALWDAPGRRLVCARDPLGVRPLCYWTDGRTLIWASEPRQLLADPRVAREPNEGMVAEYLSGVVARVDETLYRGVMRLPPGHLLIAEPEGLVVRRYWSPEAREPVTRSLEESAECFFSLFYRATEARLETAGPVGVWLSGGLDSSSVVGMAGEVARHRSTPPLEAFSVVFPDRPETDESVFIADVVGMWGIPSHRLEPSTPSAEVCWEQACRRLDVPDLTNDALGKTVLDAMRRRGLRVALTGFGGDQGLTGNAYQYADLLRQGELATLVRQYLDDRRNPEADATLTDLLTFGVGPLVPRWARRLVRPVVRRLRGDVSLPDWVAPAFAERTGLRERIETPRPGSDVEDLSAWYVATEFSSGWGVLATEMGERQSAEAGVEDRHPFLDRRVVELMLSFPDQTRRRGRQTKAVLRAAMRRHLPPSVAARHDKADFTHSDMAALEALGGVGFMDTLQIASEGWIDQRRVSALYREAARRGVPEGDTGRDVGALWLIASVEIWFRAAIARSSGRAMGVGPMSPMVRPA